MELTETQTTWLIEHRNDGDQINYIYGEGTTISQLKALHIIENREARGYRFTPKGQWLADQINKHILDRDFNRMSLAERKNYAAHHIGRSTTDDLHTLLNDRSPQIRYAAAKELDSRGLLDQTHADKLAHDRNNQIRQLAVRTADPIEYADETDNGVLYALAHSERDLTPLFRALVTSAQRERRLRAVDFATRDDIPQLLSDKDASVRRSTIINHGQNLTSEQIDQLLEDPDPNVRLSVVYSCNRFTDKQIERIGEDPELHDNLELRLDLYRREYRRFHQHESLFADPEGTAAKAQRRMALAE